MNALGAKSNKWVPIRIFPHVTELGIMESLIMLMCLWSADDMKIQVATTAAWDTNAPSLRLVFLFPNIEMFFAAQTHLGEYS